jgi:hypothetical protein
MNGVTGVIKGFHAVFNNVVVCFRPEGGEGGWCGRDPCRNAVGRVGVWLMIKHKREHRRVPLSASESTKPRYGMKP